MASVVKLMITAFSFLIGIKLARCNVVDFSVYIWTEKPREYSSEGKRLDSNVLEEFPNSHLVTQCAYGCLRNRKCTAYNYRKKDAICQLLAETHLTHPEEIVDDDGSQYYLRDAFVIDEVRLLSS